jgi:hypothetical protein
VTFPAANPAFARIPTAPLPFAIAVTLRYVLVFVPALVLVVIAGVLGADATTMLLRIVLFWISAVSVVPDALAITWSTTESPAKRAPPPAACWIVTYCRVELETTRTPFWPAPLNSSRGRG